MQSAAQQYSVPSSPLWKLVERIMAPLKHPAARGEAISERAVLSIHEIRCDSAVHPSEWCRVVVLVYPASRAIGPQ